MRIFGVETQGHHVQDIAASTIRTPSDMNEYMTSHGRSKSKAAQKKTKKTSVRPKNSPTAPLRTGTVGWSRRGPAKNLFHSPTDVEKVCLGTM